MGIISRGFKGRRHDGPPDRVPPGQYLTDDFPVLSAGPTPHTPLERVDVHDRRAVTSRVSWSWDEFRELASETTTTDIHCVTKWSKLDTVWEGVSVDTLLDRVEHDATYLLAFCDGGYTTNLPLEDVTGRPGLGRVRLRRRAARARARRPRAAARPAPVLLEEREMGARLHAPRRGRARVLGVQRLPHATAIHGRNSGTGATDLARSRRCVERRRRRRRGSGRSGSNRPAGRATAPGSTSTSGSPPRTAIRRSAATRSRPRPRRAARDHGRAARRRRGLAVPRGRGSRPGDRFELRGPIGGYFVWDRSEPGPLLLVAGGSGVVPLMAMLRHRAATGSERADAAAVLVADAGRRHLPRGARRARGPAGWARGLSHAHAVAARRLERIRTAIDAEMLREVAWPALDRPQVFVCGSTRFVDTAADGLVALGYEPQSIKTERFGATGS